jgi:hypothetical protein
MRVASWSTLCIVVLAASSMTACNPAERARVATEEIQSGNAAACVEERSTIEKAVEAFTLLNPGTPVTEAALVTGGIVREESKLMDIAADGTVIASAGTVCA